MKWEAYVVKETNILKFSKLDDIGTPLRLFESFFNDTSVGWLNQLVR